MKKFARILMVMAMAFAVALPMATPALAAVNLGEGYVGNAIQLSNDDPREIVARVINVLLGFLTVIAVVIILIGGFKWMTSAGNEDSIGEAKKIIAAGAIGLVIVLASWGITTLVLSSALNATNNA